LEKISNSICLKCIVCNETPIPEEYNFFEFLCPKHYKQFQKWGEECGFPCYIDGCNCSDIETCKIFDSQFLQRLKLEDKRTHEENEETEE